MMTGISEGKIPVLSVIVIPGSKSDASELGFKWNVTKEQA